MSLRLLAPAAITVLASYALLVPSAAQANSYGDQDRAEGFNERGREHFDDEEYELALEYFDRAIDLYPDPRYFFNTCYTLVMMGEHREALSVCDEVQPPEADDELIAKRDMVAGMAEAGLEEQGAAPDGDPPSDAPGDGGDPGAAPGDGTGTGDTYDAGHGGAPGDTGHGARPPPLGDQEIPHDYSWSVGLEAGPLGNLGVGGDRYQSGGGHLRIAADVMAMSERRVGAQIYSDFSRLESDPAAGGDDGIFMVDLGGGIYHHMPLGEMVYLTPLVGAHLALQAPDGSESTFMGLGVRGQASFDFVFGGDDEHVLSVAPVGLNLYLPSIAASGGEAPGNYGLDDGGASYSFTVGYKLRFTEEAFLALE